jgi:hypothetical protein
MKYEIAPDVYEGNIVNRFVLGVAGESPFIVFGVNPNTADDQKPDHTVTKVMGFAERFHCKGWIMFNLFPLRKADPLDLPTGLDMALHKTNLDYISKVLSEFPNAMLCAAWGTHITSKKYLHACLKEIRDVAKGQWKSIGPPTQDGHPKHPSRLSYKLGLQNFDIDNYLRDPCAFKSLAQKLLVRTTL